MPKHRLPLAMSADFRFTPNSTNTSVGAEQIAGLVNMEIVPDPNTGEKAVARRSGVELVEYQPATNLDYPGGGIYSSAEDRHFVAGFDLVPGYSRFMIYDVGTSTEYEHNLTTVYNITRYHFVQFGDSGACYFVGNYHSAGHVPWMWYTNGTAAPTAMSTGTHGIPSKNFIGLQYLDDYLFALTYDGFIYNSNLSTPNTWTSTDVIGATAQSDTKVYLAKHKDHLVVFGTRYTEFYYNAGNPGGSPLSPRQDLKQSIGVHATVYSGWDSALSGAIDSDDDIVAFLASGNIKTMESGDISDNHDGVWILDNFQFKKISTPAIDNLISQSINSVGTNPNIRLVSYRGKKLVILSILAGSDGVPVFDIEQGAWYVWSWASEEAWTITYAQNGEWMYGFRGSIGRFNVTLTEDQISNTPTYFEYPTQIYIPSFDGGTYDKKFCFSTAIVGDRAQAQHDWKVSWSDDDYETYNTARTVDLQYLRPLYRCGNFRFRTWKLEQTSSETGAGQPVRLKALELDLNVGTSNRSTGE